MSDSQEIFKKSDIAVRQGVEEDKKFVFSTMLRGLYYGDSHLSYMEKDSFMRDYHQVIEGLLKHGQLLIACFKDDPSVILGYALLSQDRYNLHFVFVKKAWRNIGIMKSLVPHDTLFCTHLTKVGVSLLHKNPQIFYNPLLLER